MQLPEGDIQEYYAHAVVFCIRHFCTSFYIFIFAYHFNMFCAYLYVRMSLSDKTDYTYVLSNTTITYIHNSVHNYVIQKS